MRSAPRISCLGPFIALVGDLIFRILGVIMNRLGFLLTVTLVLFAGSYAQEPSKDSDGTGQTADAASLTSIFSTASGGFWSSPSTWVGGVVPGPDDDVTISPGSVVVIDNVITVASLTVGINAGSIPGVLTFHPAGTNSLRVLGNLTISVLGILTTPSTGTLTNRKITIGGNLTNNGILDLSTNGNQAGADLIFTGANNNTFGGGGSQTNIRTITVDKGTSNASILELNPLNFTVQGSSTDSAASGYLTLTNGTFKISGTFLGNHRTFGAAAYTIPATTRIWMNNPNYTVTAQTGDVTLSGRLQMSAGIFNVGTAVTDSIRFDNFGGRLVVDGGSVNIAGSLRRGGFPGINYTQSGGTVTTCIAGNFAPCYDLGGNGTGGTLVIQTPRVVPDDNFPDFAGGVVTFGSPTATTVRFGNAGTSGTGIFTCVAEGVGDVAIDTTAGLHTLRVLGNSQSVFGSINIGAGGTMDIGDTRFYISGPTFVNNGTFKVKPTSLVSFFDPMGTVVHNVNYLGTGSFSGPVAQLYLKQSNLTLDPAANSIRAKDMRVDSSNIVNAGRLTIGNNDNIASTIQIEGTGAFDSAPAFDLGTGGQKLIYSNAGTRTIGPELNPARQLVALTHDLSTGTLSFSGGDITLNGSLNIFNGVIDTGTNRLFHQSGDAFRSANAGFIRGTLVRRFSDATPNYTYFVGDNHYARVQIIASSVPTFSDVAISPHDETLTGLPPATSVSFSWGIEQVGAMTSSLQLNYDSTDANGALANYRLWKSTGGTPVVVSSTPNPPGRNVTASGLTNLTANWGISERLPNISISGSVTTSGGMPIRSATVTLSGGNLAAPRVFQTGSFGTYSIGGVESGFEYTISVSAKRNRFTPSSQTITPTATISDLNFVANPPD